MVMTVGLRKGTAPLLAKHEGTTLGTLINNSVSFTTGATLSALSCYLTRKGEIKSGIDVMSPNGETMGQSKAAAKIAVYQTSSCRFLY